MGEIADSLLDGEFDYITGEYLGPGVGYPRTMERGEMFSMDEGRTYRNNPVAGIQGWLMKKKCKEDPEVVVRAYQDEVLHIEGTPKYKTICKRISNTCFGEFMQWFNTSKFSRVGKENSKIY